MKVWLAYMSPADEDWFNDCDTADDFLAQCRIHLHVESAQRWLEEVVRNIDPDHPWEFKYPWEYSKKTKSWSAEMESEKFLVYLTINQVEVY